MHGTYETVDGRPALRFERRLRHPVERVWRAVSEPGELAHWFPAVVTLAELRAGAPVGFAFPEGGHPPMEGSLLEVDEPRLLVLRWGDEVLRFELSELDGGAGCLLRFTHLLSDRDAAARDAAGWSVCLQRLDDHLDGREAAAPGTEPTPEWREHYDAYVARGLPSGAPVP